LTVSSKVVADVNAPSLTEIVMETAPNSLAVGVIVTVLPVPVPLNAIFSMATRVIFDESADNVRLSPSTSVTVKPIGFVAVSSFVD
jgi:hypothetical protein